MSLTHDYIHQSRGYRAGVGCCWMRLYRSIPGDAPVVLCSDLPLEQSFEVSDNAGCLAAEVVLEHFPEGLPDLPRPLLWIEHRPSRRRGPGRYHLLTFPSYEPHPAGAGFVRRVTLGPPRCEPLALEEVAVLTREE